MLLTAAGALGGLTFVLASLLVVASRKLHVDEDPRIDVVEEMLPHVNCGACGLPGCRPFAEALVSGSAVPAACTVSSELARSCIADFLDIEVGTQERKVARLACAGGSNVARNHAHYGGLMSCGAAAQVAGGGKGCFWGCLGLADCERACDFDAIRMNAHALPLVDETRCTACGDCVDACPKDLFSLQPEGRRLWVACSSLASGDDMLEDCQVGCTGCGRCAHDAPELISMKEGLAVIDYARDHRTQLPIQRCPTGAIVWLDPVAGAVKGPAARPVIRKGALPDAPT